MKLTPDDPRLTAYALGELNDTERAEVEAALERSPECQREVEAIRQTAQSLEQEFVAELGSAQTEADRAAVAGIVPQLPTFESGNAWSVLKQRLSWKHGLSFAGAMALLILFAWITLPKSGENSIPLETTSISPANSVQEFQTLKSDSNRVGVNQAVVVSRPAIDPKSNTVPAAAPESNQSRFVQNEMTNPLQRPVPATRQIKRIELAATHDLNPNLSNALEQSGKAVTTTPDLFAQTSASTPALAQSPISLKYPMPTLKGTPDDLPKGPNIEPLPEKPPGGFMAPVGVRNLALGRPVSSSDRNPITGALTMITDGDKEAFDDQVIEMRKGVQWVQIDLGQPFAIYAIAMWHDHRWIQLYRDVIVQLADDPDFTQNVRTVFNNDLDNSSGQGIGKDKEYFETQYGKVVDAKGEVARYVRLFTKGSNLTALNCYSEVEVYGLPIENTSPPQPSIAGLSEAQKARQFAEQARSVSGNSLANSARVFQPSTSIQAEQNAVPSLVPLRLKLPMPTLKGHPDDWPKGFHLELPPDGKPPKPLLTPAGVTNVALGKPVTANPMKILGGPLKQPVAGSLHQITDGQKEAFDEQVVQLRPGLGWIQVDLGQPFQIYAVAFWHDFRWYNKHIQDVVVQIADDAGFMQNVRILFNNDYDNSTGLGIGISKEYFETNYGKMVDGKGEVARYVRSYSNGSNLDRMNYWMEIEVYALPMEAVSQSASSSTNSRPVPIRYPMPALK